MNKRNQKNNSRDCFVIMKGCSVEQPFEFLSEAWHACKLTCRRYSFGEFYTFTIPFLIAYITKPTRDRVSSFSKRLLRNVSTARVLIAITSAISL